MEKEFISLEAMRDNALKLAHRMYNDGFIPDIIYVLLRGGALMGNIFSEFFKLVKKDDKPVFYAAVVARSYTDLHERGRVRIDGWTYDPQHLRSGDRVLIIDDIFDTGRTINYLVDCIMERGVPAEHIKVAVHDYKKNPECEQLPVQPDYWCREKFNDNTWIHYMSHELEGLSDQEIEEYYLSGSKELAEVFDTLKCIQQKQHDNRFRAPGKS